MAISTERGERRRRTEFARREKHRRKSIRWLWVSAWSVGIQVVAFVGWLALLLLAREDFLEVYVVFVGGPVVLLLMGIPLTLWTYFAVFKWLYHVTYK